MKAKISNKALITTSIGNSQNEFLLSKKYLALRKRSAAFFILSLYFLLLASVFRPFTYEGKNLIFMAWTFLGAGYLLVSNRKFPLTVSQFFFILPIYLGISFLINLGKSELASFVYSLFFLFAYYIFISFFKKKISISDFNFIILITLLAYFTVLVAGQIYVQLGYFRGSHITAGITHDWLGTLYEAGRGFRYYSLSTEPSYAAFIVVILFYAYIESSQAKFSKRSNILIAFMLLYMLLFFQSAYGVILLVVLIISKTTIRNSILIAVAGGIIFLVAALMKQPAAERVFNLVTNVDFSNLESMASVDYSASFRVLPSYFYIINFDFFDYHSYLGFGAGQSEDFLIPLLFNVPMDTFQGGFLPQFIYDYGLLFGIIFFIFLKLEVLPKIVSFETFVICLMLTNANFNTQLFWFAITCFALLKFYKKNMRAESAFEKPLNN